MNSTIEMPVRHVKLDIDVSAMQKEQEALEKILAAQTELSELSQICTSSTIKNLNGFFRNVQKQKGKVDESLAKVRKCVKLAEEFRIVTLDPMKRKIPRPRLRGENQADYKRLLEAFYNVSFEDIDEGQTAKKSVKKKAATWFDEGYRPVKVKKKAARKKAKKKAAIKYLVKGDTINVPLVWVTDIPAKPSVSLTVRITRDYRRQAFEITAKTPNPTPEATKMLEENFERFDSFQLWWVPKDLEVKDVTPVQPIPRDPILVGVMNLDSKKIYFELTRWIEEDVEVSWWSQEAY